jgi:hypothetical protein
MNPLKLPGFTAEISLAKHRTGYRLLAGGNRDASAVVIPQMSCWRLCYDISSTNSELAGCYRVCSRLKEIFPL